MENKGKKFNWIKSILINLAIAAFMLLFTHMIYETNDDFVISSRIADGYPEVYFINYCYCLILTKLQTLLPLWNMHVVVQIVLSFVSFVCILKLILDNSRSKIISVAATAVLFFFSIDQYTTVQFTKTAALITTAGALLLIDALIKSRNLFYYTMGFILFFVGACLRIEGVVVPFGFAGIYAIAWMIDNRRDLKDFLRSKLIITLLVIFALAGGSAALHFSSVIANSRTPELKRYVEYNDLRSAVIDYSRLDYYDEQKSEYEKAGFSNSDIKLIRAWMFDYDGAASADNLKKIIEISDGADKDAMTAKIAVRKFVRDSYKNARAFTPMGVHIIALVLLGIWLLLAGKWSTRFFVLLTAAAVVVLHVYLYYIERPAYRAFYVPDICAAVFMLYALSGLGELPKWKVAPGIAVALMMIVMLVPVYKDSLTVFHKAEKRIMSEEFTNYLKDNKDTFYVVATREKKINPSYLTPWKAPDTSIDANCMGTGSWGTLSPYMLDKMVDYGMQNPIKDLIDNDKARYVGNKNIKALTEYYNKWYGGSGKTIRLIEDGKVNGLQVWAVKSN